MWDAAFEFSAVAYPENSARGISEGARCPLCQQTVGADAAARFKHFAELVTSTAQADVRAAETVYANLLSAVSKVTVDRGDVALALDEIQADEPALATRVSDFLRDAIDIKGTIGAAAQSGKSLPKKGVPTNPEADLRGVASRFRKRATQLRGQNLVMDPKDAAELKELEARVAFRSQVDLVIEEIERRKRAAAYGQCIEDTNTNPITRKSTELTKRLVTDRLRDQFQEELRNLEFTHLAVEIRAAGGTRGTLFHQLVFSNAPGVVVSNVLSEGEARTLSLASFLAELSTATARSAIISDDPVSSLDHIWRERIARRLVAEARVRQVIIFTHDLFFLRNLIDECKEQEVPHQHQWVRRGSEASGICSSDLPWVAMRVKERLGVLRARWQDLDKLYRNGSSDAYEREAREMYGLLREAWEKTIEEVLLNDVVERFRRSVESKRVRNLYDITKEDCEGIERGMTECSRWIRGHDESPADGTPFPKPGELEKRIKALDDCIQRIRKRRDAKKGP
jgi:hypothetical protein